MLSILFVSDYVCPYCLVAKEALKEALKETGLCATFTYQIGRASCRERV